MQSFVPSFSLQPTPYLTVPTSPRSLQPPRERERSREPPLLPRLYIWHYKVDLVQNRLQLCNRATAASLSHTATNCHQCLTHLQPTAEPSHHLPRPSQPADKRNFHIMEDQYALKPALMQSSLFSLQIINLMIRTYKNLLTLKHQAKTEKDQSLEYFNIFGKNTIFNEHHVD